MKVDKLARMHRGWIVGDFEPSVLRTAGFEVAVQRYVAGAREPRHRHDLAIEITVVLEGEVRVDGVAYGAGDILVVERGEAIAFEAITDATTLVVKTPSVPGDKHPC